MAENFAKISRYGESFWIRNIREVEPGIYVGSVDNDLCSDNLFKIGDAIPFAKCEIMEWEVWKPKLPHP